MDIQSAVHQRAGVGRYTKQLVESLSEEPDNDELILFCFDFRRKGAAINAGRATRRVCRWCPGRIAQYCWKSLQWPPYQIFAGGADLYHFPNFILPPLPRAKSVVTVHDVGFLKFPQFAEDRNQRYLSARIRDTVNRACAIITVSQTVADEVHELLSVPEDKLFAVHSGISGDFCNPGAEATAGALRRLSIDGPYLLTVNTIEPRKNIPLLVEIFERLTDYDGTLVIAGMPGWKYEPVMERIEASPRRGRIRYLRYVADEDLPALMSGADLFVFTSFYEGFGFPPLEAMSCGTPVVSSVGGSLPEVLGDAAVLVKSFSADKWEHEVRRALSDTGLRAKLSAEGRKRAAAYNWSQTAAKTWEVYRSLQ